MSQRIPLRSEVAVDDTWDLSRLFTDGSAWESAFREWESLIPVYASFRNRLGDGPQVLLECLLHDSRCDRLADRVSTYAFLRASEDVADSAGQAMKSRCMGLGARAAEAASFVRPELLALSADRLQSYIEAPELAPYRLVLERIRRYQPHTLSASEERLLAMQAESAATAHEVFDQLLNADLKFGTIELAPGESVELSHATYAALLENPDRDVRKRAFHQYYAEYADHANTFAAALAGSVKQDVYHSRIRNYPSALESALFPDRVPPAVYDNLVAGVRAALPAVHRYYQVRRRLMNLDAIHFYDTYVPIVPDATVNRSWAEAVEVVLEAVRPLGSDYVDALAVGLRGRWCDRYENKGKHSGAFSSGCYDSDPYILMNYRADVPDHVFTLAHEAGHSMHTLLSARNQPFTYASYTIFVAEVASTFNEQLLGRWMLARVTDRKQRAYLINREIDDLRRTIVRQTMFAEYERMIHSAAESNEPLTLESLRTMYRGLLDAYFGPEFAIDDELSLEGLRIQHFYRAYYVYKYATGLSAAIALADRVLNGGAAELNDYLGFLKGGCSKDPLDLLRGAGVDMSTPQPIQAALRRFSTLTDELERLLSGS